MQKKSAKNKTPEEKLVDFSNQLVGIANDTSPKPAEKKLKPKEYVNQAAKRIVRESTKD